MSWATLQQARRWWPESATLPDDLLGDLLESSTYRCQVFTESDPASPGPVPLAWAMASVLDARDVHAARLSDGADPGAIMAGDYVLRPRPLSVQVRGLLRPPRPAVAR